jgi:uncharacterized membrane protein YjdF
MIERVTAEVALAGRSASYQRALLALFAVIAVASCFRDIWDAQKDMSLASAGAVLALVVMLLAERIKGGSKWLHSSS